MSFAFSPVPAGTGSGRGQLADRAWGLLAPCRTRPSPNPLPAAEGGEP